LSIKLLAWRTKWSITPGMRENPAYFGALSKDIIILFKIIKFLLTQIKTCEIMRYSESM
jgi:hypothetical protein